MVIETRPEKDLVFTRTTAPEAFLLAKSIKEQYGRWLFDRNVDKGAVRRHYDELRLRVLQMIVETTPSGYRVSDAQFLAGQVLFEMNRAADAARIWRRMTPQPTDMYHQAAREVLAALNAGATDSKTIRQVLGREYGRWRLFSIDRLRQFGHHCDTF